MFRCGTVVWCVMFSAVFLAVSATVEAARPKPLTAEEIKRMQSSETDAQKKLRSELKQLAEKRQVIYFSSDFTGKRLVYRVAPDGSGLKCLTPNLLFADKPHVSPDGKKLVINMLLPEAEVKKLPGAKKRFVRGRRMFKGKRMAMCLGIVDLESGEVKPLTVGDNGHWSPDGKKIVFNTMKKPRKIVIFDVETKEEKTIQNVPATAMFPNFTPNGKYVIIGGYPFTIADLVSGKVKKAGIGSGCNNEVSKDGRHLVWVIDTFGDTGGWLCAADLDQESGTLSNKRKLPLGWVKNSVNYYPDFSPCGKYLVYAHGERMKGKASYHARPDLELYVTRFPDCSVTVRITWNRGANFHTCWAVGKN